MCRIYLLKRDPSTCSLERNVQLSRMGNVSILFLNSSMIHIVFDEIAVFANGIWAESIDTCVSHLHGICIVLRAWKPRFQSIFEGGKVHKGEGGLF